MAIPGANRARVDVLQNRLSAGGLDPTRAAKVQNRINRLSQPGQRPIGFTPPAGAAPVATTPGATTPGLGNQITGATNDFGSRTIETDANGNTTQKDTMAPDQKGLLDDQVGRDQRFGDILDSQIGGVQQAYANPLDISGIGNDPRNMDFQANRKAMEDRYMGRFNELNGQRFTDDQNSLEQQMANRGIAPGNPLYEKEMQRLSRQQADERSGALMNALNMSGTEMQRDYSLGADARDRSINETQMLRQNPYEEMSKILGSVQGPMLPQFQDILGTSVGMRGQDMAQGQFDQTMNFNRKQNALDRKQQSYLANLNRGGRGGGGGGSAPIWAKNGFNSMAEQDAYEREQKRLDYEMAQRYQPKQPSFGQQLIGAGLPAAIQGAFSYFGGGTK